MDWGSLQCFTDDRDPSEGVMSYAGKWKGTTVAVKILEHSAESSSGLKELRESVLSSSIIHPNVVSTYKIRTLPTASRKPLPQVGPGCCMSTMLGLTAHLEACPKCSTLPQRCSAFFPLTLNGNLEMLYPFSTSSRVAMLAAHDHSLVLGFCRP